MILQVKEKSERQLAHDERDAGKLASGRKPWARSLAFMILTIIPIIAITTIIAVVTLITLITMITISMTIVIITIIVTIIGL